MAFYVPTANATNWTLAPDAPGATGPVFGFDTTLGRPIWRAPDGTTWVDAQGNVVGSGLTGSESFNTPENSGLIAIL